MININKIGDYITGSYNNKQFGIKFNATTYKTMLALQDKANNATSVSDLDKIYEEFEPLTKEDFNAKIQAFAPNIFVDSSNRYYLQSNKVVSSVAMPEALVQRIKDSIDKGIDTTPLIKFWTRFLRNPKLRKGSVELRHEFSNKVFNYVNLKYTNHELANELVEKQGVTQEVANELATTYQVKITQEGLLATFKVSNEITKKWILNDKDEKEQVDMYPVTKTIDPISGLITYGDPDKGNNENRVFEPAVQHQGGDEFYCGDKLGHVIRVGQVHRLPDWSFVNTNDNQSCVKGLHIGGLDYIRGYQGSGTETHNVFVDPAHIGAVPDDHTGAIRVIQYFVKDAFSGVNGSIYHSSTYASQTDKQWSDYRAEIIKAFGTLQESTAKQVANETAEIDAI